MTEGLRLEIEAPSDGWAIVRLNAPDSALEFDASYVPYDSIGDLANAAFGLIDGVPEQIVNWNTEPIEYQFRFSVVGVRTRLDVKEFPDTRRRKQRGSAGASKLTIEEDTIAIASALWHGLRNLQGAVTPGEFETAWRSPFPTATVERLGEQLRMHPSLARGDVADRREK